MNAGTQNRPTQKAMRWPEIFFKTRIPNLASAPEAPSKMPAKMPAKMPSISELEKSVEPPVVKVATDKTAEESLRALKQSDTIRIVPRGKTETTPVSGQAGDLPRDVAPPAAAGSTADIPRVGAVSFRRRAKLTDFARILLPKREESSSQSDSPATSTSPSAVVPAAFPVAGTAGNVIEAEPEKKEKINPEASPASTAKPDEPPPAEKSDSSTDSAPSAPPVSAPVDASPAHESSPPLKATTRVTLPDLVMTPDKPSSPSVALETDPSSSDTRERKEFILANGERIFGHVLSETAETIYLDHHTLGVLTLPRTQIAGKPIEVILINGDRIVGDLIAETTECLYVRHASLGMLTVPHNQRSTRVVEAILKDGDRILGEVLAETDHFTVIRSATLGTVAVQHEQVAMLNRKIEQMQLRALPAPSPEEPKPASS
jgi:RNase P/RNase MRP subunit p29